MFESITQFFKRFKKSEKEESKSTAKERLHLVLAQDRANISADFLEMMKQEILEVIKKYIDIDEKAIDVRLTNKEGEDGSVGAPALYANIPIITIRNEARKLEGTLKKEEHSDKKIEVAKEEVANEEEQQDDDIQEGKNSKAKDKKQNMENNSEEDNEKIENGDNQEENKQQELKDNNMNEVDNEEENS